MNYISEHKPKIIEGQLRCEELSQFLDKLNAPRTVWLSEDGSGIVSKVSYDSSTNQMVGLVLPTNRETGMPIPFTFVPSSVNEIEKQLEYPKSTLVYIIMAQSIKENIPPFVLQIFGTDNKFLATDVMSRWKFIKAELRK